MSLQKVEKFLERYELQNRIIKFSSCSATVKEAACLLKCKDGDICKTMAFWKENTPILILLAGDKKIDNSKYKKEFGVKAKMIEKNDLVKVIGHDMGGVCAFGIPSNVEIYLDISLKEHEILYPAAGTDKSAVKLTLNEIETILNYIKYVDVTKNENI